MKSAFYFVTTPNPIGSYSITIKTEYEIRLDLYDKEREYLKNGGKVITDIEDMVNELCTMDEYLIEPISTHHLTELKNKLNAC